MARARSPDRIKAEEIYLKNNGNIELVKIAEMLERPDGTIRGWKNKDCWDEKLNGTFQEKDNKKVERSKPKKRKRGGQPGNKNAVGHGAPKGNKNNYKHGLYETIYWDTITEEELQMVQNMHYEEERLLEEQIALLTIRERRLMKSIEEKKNAKGGLALESVVSRSLEIKGNIIKGEQQKQTETTTRTISTFEVIQKLEAELTRVQARKTRCIEALNKIRLERQKLASDSEDEIADLLRGLVDDLNE